MCVVVAVAAAACSAGPIPPSITQVGSAPATTTGGTDVTVSSLAPAPTKARVDERASERMEMVEDDIAARGIEDPAVLAAMEAVPRHRFVPEEWQDLAYRDHPLPIGYGQTISQPYIVALMTEALGVEPGDKVLEIGTGSGYQAAVLAEMEVEVFTIEIISELAETAATALREAGYAVRSRTADGYFGWQEEAPFDAIVVTAAPDHVPQPLVEQLVGRGVMVIPVGPIGAVQTLWKFTRTEEGNVLAKSLGPVAFVPFTREDD